MNRYDPSRALLVALLASFASQTLAADPAPSPEQSQFFESKIRPVLVANCVKCHGPEKQKSGLRLDSRAALLAGGEQGPSIIPGKADESLLIAAVRHEDDLKMPPSKKLPVDQVADLTRWITMGAPWPGSTDAEPASTSTIRKSGLAITDKDRAHWAFQSIKRPSSPSVHNLAWVANPIDAFILAKLDAKGLRPSPPASKLELARRLYYDLTGLPPTPREAEAFISNPSPNAYEQLVDRLLDSPHYGEKWGRHWLDLVRYAETNSYERDNPKPSAWRFRDYVIKSFNADKPIDRFISEQLAGDEIAPGDIDALTATGYYRLGIWDDEPTDRDQARFDGLDDIVATTTQVFLGMTVDCARCHDHKIDPIPQKDYYRFVSFFHNINHFHNGGPTDEFPILHGPIDKAAHEAHLLDLKSKQNDLKSKIETIENELLANASQGGASLKSADVRKLITTDGTKLLGAERIKVYNALSRELMAAELEKPSKETVLFVTEAGPIAPDTFVLLRGNPHVPGDKIEPGFLTVLGTPPPAIPAPGSKAKTTGRRTALAAWITSPTNPLTSRVLANRVWQYHFGRGLVRSPNNFGTQGDKPTHPELLDWLASELVSNGWRLKSLHKLILTSNAYQMSSRPNPEAAAKDAMNDTFWRYDMRRLTAEEVRDSVLAVSGSLNPKMYGPGVFPEIPAEVMAGQSQPGYGWGKSSREESNRRSIYVHVKRSLLTPILESFDLAETDRSSPVRFSTTQPTQALAMLNGKFLNEQAAILAERLKREAGPEPISQVRLALQFATCRPPADNEIKRGAALLSSLQTQDGISPDEALKTFSLVVLNLNEFLFLD